MSSNIVITIKYGGLKATQFFSKYTPDAYQRLLNDLTDLGFPHPKRGNIVFLSHGTLEFFWPIAPHDKVHNVLPFCACSTNRLELKSIYPRVDL